MSIATHLAPPPTAQVLAEQFVELCERTERDLTVSADDELRAELERVLEHWGSERANLSRLSSWVGGGLNAMTAGSSVAVAARVAQAARLLSRRSTCTFTLRTPWDADGRIAVGARPGPG